MHTNIHACMHAQNWQLRRVRLAGAAGRPKAGAATVPAAMVPPSAL